MRLYWLFAGKYVLTLTFQTEAQFSMNTRWMWQRQNGAAGTVHASFCVAETLQLV